VTLYRIISKKSEKGTYAVWYPSGLVYFGNYTDCLLFVGARALGLTEEQAKLEANNLRELMVKH